MTNGFFRGPCWRASKSKSSRERRLPDELVARGDIESQCSDDGSGYGSVGSGVAKVQNKYHRRCSCHVLLATRSFEWL